MSSSQSACSLLDSACFRGLNQVLDLDLGAPFQLDGSDGDKTLRGSKNTVLHFCSQTSGEAAVRMLVELSDLKV